MDLKTIQHKGWTLHITSNINNDEGIFLFEQIINDEYSLKSILKNNYRSVVKRIESNKLDLVYKIPNEKNERSWIRFLTLFRKGEALKNLESMITLNSIGIKTTTPILAAEQRVNGMITNSWLLYEYVDGKNCLERPDTYSKVFDTLQAIHNNGLIHGDSQIRNFIEYNDDIYVIDANPKKAGITGFDFGYEWAYLRKSDAGIQKYLDKKIQSRWYSFAIWYDKLERKMTRSKRRFKSLIGLTR